VFPAVVAWPLLLSLRMPAISSRSARSSVSRSVFGGAVLDATCAAERLANVAAALLAGFSSTPVPPIAA
jgi:hypothetical protein